MLALFTVSIYITTFDIDLMDDDNFWENNNIQACEWGTKKSRDVDAYCEKCEHEFKVDLVY